MKKPARITLFLIGWLFLLQSTSAQTIHRHAGNLGFTSGIADMFGNKTYDVNGYYHTTLNLGFFPSDDFAFGLEVDFSNIRLENGDYPAYGIGPYIRLYIVKNFYSHASYEIGLAGDDAYSYNKFTFNLGYSLFLFKYMALEPRLFYVLHNESGNSYDFKGPGIGLGLQSFLNR